MKIYGDKQSSSVLGLVGELYLNQKYWYFCKVCLFYYFTNNCIGAVDSLVYATIGVLNLAVFSYTESFLPYFLR